MKSMFLVLITFFAFISARIDAAPGSATDTTTPVGTATTAETSEAENKQVEQILKSLQEGDKVIESWKRGDYIVILGISGSGKSTLVLFVTNEHMEVVDRDSDLVFDDNDKKISTNSFQSKTFYPDIIVDPLTKEIFIDCPGFDDTRNREKPDVDIATNYFIKKALGHAVRLKFVFTVVHSSVRSGVERHGFLKLLDYACKIIRNVENYEYILMVTKVDIRKGKNENDYVDYTANYVTRAKDFLQNELDNTDDKGIINQRKCMIHVATTFLKQDAKSRYTNIGIFRRPDEEGPVSLSPVMSTARTHLRNVLLGDKSQYKVSQSNHFNVQLADKSKVQLQTSIIPKLFAQMRQAMSQIFSTKENDIENLVTVVSEPDILLEKLNSILITFNDIKNENFTLERTVELLLSFIKNEKSIYNIDFIRKTLGTVSHLQFFIGFVDLKPNFYQEFEMQLHKNKMVNYLTNSIKSIEFVKVTSKLFSNYETFRQFYNLVNSNHATWNYIETNRKISIKKSNINELLNFLRRQTIVEQSFIYPESMVHLFNNALSTILMLEQRCDGDLTFTGRNILVSQLSFLNCPNAEKISVFASDTIFIDSDLDFIGKEKSIVLIAPVWKVTGAHKIILDGSSGNKLSSTKSPIPGRKGASGNVGNPGGNFFGVGQTFFNVGDLLISSNGGAGSSGESGGDGTNGLEGTTPTSKSNERKEVIRSENIGGHTTVHGLRFYGRRGTSGGDGGDGGKAGQGGNAGQIIVIPLRDELPATFKRINNVGLNGEPGKGGTGGRSPSNPGHYLDEIESCFHPCKICQASSCNKERNYMTYAVTNGNNGRDNANEEGRRIPSTAKQIIPMEFVVSFKKFIRSCVDCVKYSSTSSEFLRDLYFNEKLKPWIKLKFITDDIVNLIEDSNARQNVFFINLLLEHVLTMSSLITDKISLSEIYATLLEMKLSKFNDKNLITNLPLFIQKSKAVVRNIEQLGKSIVIDQINKNYTSDIDVMIDEATNLVENGIKFEIQKVMDNFDQNIFVLLNETISHEQRVEKEKDILIEQKEEIERNLKNTMLFGLVKSISTIFGFTSSSGAAVNTIVQLSSGIAENHLIESVDANNIQIRIPEGVINSANYHLKGIIQEQKELGLIMDDANNKLQKYPELFVGLKNKIREMKTVLAENEKIPNGDVVSKLIGLFKTSVIVEQNGLNSYINSSQLQEDEKSKYVDAVTILNTVQLITSVAEVSTQYAIKYKNSNRQLQIIVDKINQADIAIQNLRTFRDNIFKINNAISDQILSDFNNFRNNAVQKSSVRHILEKWQIQSKIKQMKKEMQTFLIGFKVESEFLNIFAMLEELANVIVAMFDKIELYQSSKSLADYLAAINTASVRGLTIPNDENRKALEKLKFARDSSLIISLANRIENSFKQQIFPFANTFLQQTPSTLFSIDTSESLALATNNINHIEDRLIDIQSSINSKFHTFIHNAVFNSRNEISKPFYTWENRKFKNEICRLFSGEEIWLRANIFDKNIQNAVKFSEIEINFRALSQNVQSKLTTLLPFFNLHMTHVGNNYFKCDHKFFVIHSTPIKIKYSFQKDSNGNPLDFNDVFELLRKGDKVLSPYTTWRCKLETKNPSMFDVLNQTCTDVDLELIGNGKYVSSDAKVCTENLSTFYEPYEDSVTNVYNYDNDEIDSIFETTKGLL